MSEMDLSRMASEQASNLQPILNKSFLWINFQMYPIENKIS